MQEFDWNSGEPITKEIAGKVVDKCEVVDEGQYNILQIAFKDGSVLRIRYDWIYEWEIRPTQHAPDAANAAAEIEQSYKIAAQVMLAVGRLSLNEVVR